MKKMTLIGLVTASLLTCAVTETLYAQGPAPDYVRIRDITYAGSGCPAGSVGADVAGDLSAFTLLFDQYQAQVGPGIPMAQKRKNCQINLRLDIPNGWSYSLFTVDTRGYVSLEPGVRALQQSLYYFQGQMRTGRLQTVVFGPADRNYVARDQIKIENQVWSPCGASRSLNINTEVRVDNSAAPFRQGMMTVDSIDGQFKQIYGVKWRRCI
jgi:hypothetical protein